MIGTRDRLIQIYFGRSLVYGVPFAHLDAPGFGNCYLHGGNHDTPNIEEDISVDRAYMRDDYGLLLSFTP